MQSICINIGSDLRGFSPQNTKWKSAQYELKVLISIVSVRNVSSNWAAPKGGRAAGQDWLSGRKVSSLLNSPPAPPLLPDQQMPCTGQQLIMCSLSWCALLGGKAALLPATSSRNFEVGAGVEGKVQKVKTELRKKNLSTISQILLFLVQATSFQLSHESYGCCLFLFPSA